MKHVRIISLLAVAAMALMAFAASSASATALYNGASKLGAGSTLDWTSINRVRWISTSGSEVLNECSGFTFRMKTTNAGGVGLSVNASLEEVSWSGCSVPTTTDLKGGIQITRIGTTTEGTVKATSEMGVTLNTIFFGVCQYGVSNGVHLGVIKSTSSGTATFVLLAITLKKSGSNFACPESIRWEAGASSTEPDNLRVEES